MNILLESSIDLFANIQNFNEDFFMDDYINMCVKYLSFLQKQIHAIDYNQNKIIEKYKRRLITKLKKSNDDKEVIVLDIDRKQFAFYPKDIDEFIEPSKDNPILSKVFIKPKFNNMDFSDKNGKIYTQLFGYKNFNNIRKLLCDLTDEITLHNRKECIKFIEKNNNNIIFLENKIYMMINNMKKIFLVAQKNMDDMTKLDQYNSTNRYFIYCTTLITILNNIKYHKNSIIMNQFEKINNTLFNDKVFVTMIDPVGISEAVNYTSIPDELTYVINNNFALSQICKMKGDKTTKLNILMSDITHYLNKAMRRLKSTDDVFTSSLVFRNLDDMDSYRLCNISNGVTTNAINIKLTNETKSYLIKTLMSKYADIQHRLQLLIAVTDNSVEINNKISMKDNITNYKEYLIKSMLSELNKNKSEDYIDTFHNFISNPSDINLNHAKLLCPNNSYMQDLLDKYFQFTNMCDNINYAQELNRMRRFTQINTPDQVQLFKDISFFILILDQIH